MHSGEHDEDMHSSFYEYQDLADILVDEIFDQFNVTYIGSPSNELFKSKGKFWYYCLGEYGEIIYINICNLTKEEMDSVEKELEEIRPIVIGRTGLEYRYKRSNPTTLDGRAVNFGYTNLLIIII